MATYLSQPYQGSQFQPGIPLDLIMQVGMAKQARHDQNLATLQDSLDRIGQHNIVKAADREVIGSKLNSVVDKMNTFAGQDLSDSRVYNQLMGISSSLYNDEDVYTRIAANRNYTEAVKNIQDIKEKHPEKYSPLNEALFLKEAAQWMNNPNQTSFTGTYKPYWDTSKKEQEIMEGLKKNPDIIREINFNKDGTPRDSWEVKRLTADKLYQGLLTGVGGQNMAQYKIEYDATNNHTVESTLDDIKAETKNNNDIIAHAQHQLDTNPNLNYADTQVLQGQIDRATKLNERLETSRQKVLETQDPNQFHSFGRYLEDRLYRLASSNQYEQAGAPKPDEWSMERFKHQNAMELQRLEGEQALRKAELTASLKGNKDAVTGKPVFTNPQFSTEFSTGVVNTLVKGDGSLSTRTAGALLNSPDKDPDKNGAISVTIQNGDEMAFDFAGTLKSQGIDVPTKQLQGWNKLMDYYNQWKETAAGHTKVRTSSPGKAVSGGEDSYDKVYKPVDEFVRMASQGKLTTGNKAVDAEISKKMKDFTSRYGIDLSDPASVKIAQRLSESPEYLEIQRKFGHALQEKSLAGPLKVTMGSGNNAFTGNDGQMYVRANVQMTGDELNRRLDDDGFLFLNSSATDKLLSKNIIKEGGENDNGDVLYNVPVILKVQKDLAQAHEEYLALQRGDKEDAKIPEYRESFLTELDYIKRVANPEVNKNIIEQATKSADEFLAKNPDIEPSKIDELKNRLRQMSYILNNQSKFDSREVLQAAADLMFTPQMLGANKDNNNTTSYMTPQFKVSGESGTANMHPWAISLGNEIAAVIPNVTFNSVYRTDDTNKRVGGAKNSYHKIGAGIDVKPADWARVPEDIKSRLVQEFQVQVINEGDHVHLEPLYRGILNRYTTTIAESHNNPGNLKYADWMKAYGATPGKDATDGGRFAVFPNIDRGLMVKKKLLFDNDTIYSNMTVDQALRKYSKNSYSGSIVNQNIQDKRMSQLTEYEKSEVFRSILKHEDVNLYGRLVQQNKI